MIKEILKKYETYVSVSQPHNTTPIFLEEYVLQAMKEYAKIYAKQCLEIAAENATILKDGKGVGQSHWIEAYDTCIKEQEFTINKDSITNITLPEHV